MEPGTVQDRRVDAMGETAELLERRLRQRDGGRERRRRAGVSCSQGGALPTAQLERQRQQPLLRTVVQVALEASALGVAGVDDAPARAFDLGDVAVQLERQALVVDRQPRLRTEVAGDRTRDEIAPGAWMMTASGIPWAVSSMRESGGGRRSTAPCSST